MKIKEALMILLVVSVLIILSGAGGCLGNGGIAGIGGKTEAAKYGVDFTFEKGIDRLSAEKELQLGQTFFVDIILENYDSDPKTGEICIRDDISDNYGGIPTQCRQFIIPGAVYVGNKVETIGSTRLAFPESGDYSYYDLPKSIQATLYASIKYKQRSVLSGVIKAPNPETETITLESLPQPLVITAEKSVSSRDNNVKASIRFNLASQGRYNITSPDFKSSIIYFSPNLGGYVLDCSTLQQTIDFRNTKFISCSALLPSEQTSHPLLVTLDYGVGLDKQFSFRINKEEK